MNWPKQYYDYISIPVTWPIQDISEIAKYGNEGWRLVTIISIKGQYPHAIFERLRSNVDKP